MSGSTSHDRDEALARAAEEIAADLAAGGTPDPAALAARHGLEESDVRRCLAALEALGDALSEDLPAADAPPALPPEYELLGEIGRGGMGIVYRVRQKSLDRTVALKLLRPGEQIFAEAVRRFEKEARTLARLRHRHIVSIHEVGRAGGNLYYTMDLIEGSSLAELIRKDAVPPTRAVRLLRQVASAVGHAHAHGLIHRDLKPENILVDRAGDAYVVDFGLARDLGAAGNATASGWILGTPAYMSPEQAQGDSARIGEATDVYALGAVLYECLTGRAPFAGPALAELIRAVVNDDPVPPRSIAPRVPRDLEVVCLKAMAKDPGRRYPTVRAFLEDLERFEEGKPVRARPPGLGERLSRFARRRSHSLVTALFTGLFAAASVYLLVLPRLGPGPAGVRASAAALHEAGEHSAARLLLERELDRDPDLLVDWAGCTLETLRDLAKAGRWKEAREIADRALARPLLSLRADFLWERARAVHRSGTPAEAREAFSGIREALEKALENREELWIYPTGREVGTVALLQRMLPVLSDPADPGHATAVAFLMDSLQHLSVQSHVSDWFEGLGEAGLPLIPAALASIPEDRAREDIGEGVRSLSERAAALSGPDLEAALASAAERPGVSARAHALLLGFLAASADLPLHVRNPFLTYDTDSEPDAAAKVIPLWKGLRGLSRSERLKRSIAVAVDAMPRATDRNWISRWLGQRTGHRVDAKGDAVTEAWTRWAAAEAGADPRLRLARAAGVDPTAPASKILDEYLRAGEGRRLLLHHLLRLSAPETARVPSFGLYDYEPRSLPMAWQRTLHPVPDEAPYLLRTCQLRLRDGSPEPLVVWNEARQLRVGEHAAFDHEVPLRPPPPAASVGWTIPGLGTPREAPAAPGFQRVRAGATLEWHLEGLRIRFGREQSVRVIGGSTLRTGGGGDLLPADFVSSPDAGRSSSSSLGGQHLFEDVLTLTLVEPPGSDPRAWSLADWRSRMKADLARIAAELEADAPLKPRERRAHYRVHNALWKLVRATWKLPLPDAREELARIGSAYERLGEEVRLEDLSASRFLAGDPAALELPETVSVLKGGRNSEEFRPDYWARAALTSTDERIRSFAFGKLKDADFAGGMEVTLDEAIREKRLDAPAWLADRVRGAASRHAREHRAALLNRLIPFLIGGGILGLLAVFFAARALRGQPLRAAPGLFGVGIAVAAFHLRIGGFDLLADGPGYGLAALGAGLAARSGRGSLRWLCPAALALAGVCDLLGFGAISAVAAAVGIGAVPALAAAVGGPPGQVGRVLRSAFFAFYVGYAAFAHGWALAGLVPGRENAFRIDGSPAVATVLILSAALVWAILHLRGAVRRRLAA